MAEAAPAWLAVARFDKPHGQHVAALATRLFDELGDEHGLSPRDRLLLQVAALLHDIGIYVSLRAHHKHAQYLLAASQIFGLSDEETAIIANIARYHRRGIPQYTVGHASRLERLLRQWQEGGLVLDEQLALGSWLAACPFCQIGQAPLAELLIEQRQGFDLWHGHQKVAPRESNQPLNVPLLSWAAGPGRNAPETDNGSVIAGIPGSASARGP